jgi:uncharacterized protein (TIGR03663 family)
VYFRFFKNHLPEIAILCVAVFLRVWLIEIKPPHFDEGINGWFADQMTANGYYRYDPTNYHGPLHFYGVFLSQTLFGRELWALRLPAMVASILCVLAMVRFREFFGSGVTRLASLAMAISPGFVFYGRYSIHESWQVLFSILFVQGWLGLRQSGSRRHFFTLILSATGMILTKETYLLHIGCCVLAALVLWLWEKMLPSRPASTLAKPQWTRDDAILGIGGAALVIVFFYSGTFRDFGALKGLYETFTAWVKTGVDSGGHEKKTFDLVGPFNWYWVALMARYECPALLGLLASFRYIWPSDSRMRFLAIAGCGTLLAYSVIPYKTPWCVISIIWPFYLILAGLLQEWHEKSGKRRVWFIAIPALIVSLFTCIRLNFFEFTNDSEPYVYVQTYEDIWKFSDPILKEAKSTPEGYHMEGIIILDSYYPLPWILGDFTKVGYYRKDNRPSRLDADFILIDTAQENETEKLLTQPYHKIQFRLRSGQEDCTAYLSTHRFPQAKGTKPGFVPSVNPEK